MLRDRERLREDDYGDDDNDDALIDVCSAWSYDFYIKFLCPEYYDYSC